MKLGANSWNSLADDALTWVLLGLVAEFSELENKEGFPLYTHVKEALKKSPLMTKLKCNSPAAIAAFCAAGQFKLNIDSLDMTELEGQIKGARDSAVNEASGLVKSGVGGAMELKDDALAKVTDLTANTQDSAKALTAQAARTVNDKVSRRDGK